VKKALDYHLHAQECLTLAAQMKTGDQREQLLKMAEMWEHLAQDRSTLVRNHPELEQASEEGASSRKDVRAAPAF